MTLLALTAIGLTITQKVEDAPKETLEKARLAISAVKLEYGVTYAPGELEKSMNYYDSAMEAWKQQNEKVMISRDYSLSNYYADQSIFWAQSARDAARMNLRNAQKLLTRQREELADQLKQFKMVYQPVLMGSKDLNAFAKVQILLKESESIEDVTLANQHIAEAKQVLDRLEEGIQNRLKTYFEDYSKWQRHYQAAIEQSAKRREPLVVVDKLAGKCFLYRSGKLKQSFDVEMGPNWLGDKQHAGDKRTPEGIYQVVKKKKGTDTRYHKALLINYPNEEDQKKFDFHMAQGTYSPNTQIGGLIELHGHGGKGTNWTDGCIALPNEKMDRLFDQCEVGTSVVIVGSLKPLHQLLL